MGSQAEAKPSQASFLRVTRALHASRSQASPVSFFKKLASPTSYCDAEAHRAPIRLNSHYCAYTSSTPHPLFIKHNKNQKGEGCIQLTSCIQHVSKYVPRKNLFLRHKSGWLPSCCYFKVCVYWLKVPATLILITRSHCFL